MGADSKLKNLLQLTNLQNVYQNLYNSDLNGDGVVDNKDKKLFKNLDANYDLNGDGKVDSKDKKLFKQLDTNSDGKINSKDLKSINKDIKNLLKSDKTFDLNGDGNLDAKDFVKFIKLISNDKNKKKYGLTDEMIESLTKTFVEKTLDSDKNGQINIVDLEYFANMLNKLDAYIDSQSTSDLGSFSKDDVNLNGDKKVNKNDSTLLRDTVISAIEKYTGISMDFITPPQEAPDVDGKIDGFEQGYTGDCWLLAGIRALANTKQGAQILEKSIRKNEDGSVTVIFGGLGVSYTVSADELKQHDTDDIHNDSYSNGDNDVLAIELACEKLHRDIKSGKVKCPKSSNFTRCDKGKTIEGGWAEWLIYYFTGVVSKCDGESGHRRSKERIESNLKKFNPNLAMTFMLKGKCSLTCTDGSEFKLDLGDGWHELTITNVEKDANGKVKTVTFMNPWYNKEYTVTLKEFQKLEIVSFTRADLSDTNIKSDIRDMSDYQPPENKQYTDKNGNKVVDKYVTLHGQRVLQQRTTTAKDGTVTIEKYELMDKATQGGQNIPSYGGSGRYQNVVQQKVVILPDGTSTTTEYGYELANDNGSKYVLKTSTSISSDGTNSTSMYETINGKSYETKRVVTDANGNTTTYNYKIVNGKKCLTSVVEKDANDTVTETNYKINSDGKSTEDTKTVTDKDGNRVYYEFKEQDGKLTPVEVAKSKITTDFKWGEKQGSYEIKTANGKTQVIIYDKNGKKLSTINVADYTNDFSSVKVQNTYIYNDNQRLSQSTITIKCGDSSTITITLTYDKDGNETDKNVVKS